MAVRTPRADKTGKQTRGQTGFLLESGPSITKQSSAGVRKAGRDERRRGRMRFRGNPEYCQPFRCVVSQGNLHASHAEETPQTP